MDGFKDFHVAINVEEVTGLAIVTVTELDEDGQWSWVADCGFGPFDTAQDIVVWLTKALSPKLRLRAR
jgi:hypothetical protein